MQAEADFYAHPVKAGDPVTLSWLPADAHSLAAATAA
jgi:hypothetical protein